MINKTFSYIQLQRQHESSREKTIIMHVYNSIERERERDLYHCQVKRKILLISEKTIQGVLWVD